jgi:tagatose 6-phosphate kinase
MTALSEPLSPAPRSTPVSHILCVAVNPSIDKIAAVDRLIPGEIHRPELLSAVAGGKPVNVARAAARLGLPVALVLVVAGDHGTWLESSLAREGIAARPVRVAGETRTCLSILDRSTGFLTEFYEQGPALDDEGWSAVEAAVAAQLAVDAAGCVVVLSGSLPPGAPSDGYARIVRLARDAGARTAVDADGELLALALTAGPWLAKGNAAEAGRATGLAVESEADARAAAVALQARGAGIALVSRGLEGTIVVDEEGTTWRIGPPPERGAYPVGSGDSALAGFLAAIAAGATTAVAARHAVAAGSANALRPGQGEIEAADIERILPRVTLDRVGPEPARRKDPPLVADRPGGRSTNHPLQGGALP